MEENNILEERLEEAIHTAAVARCALTKIHTSDAIRILNVIRGQKEEICELKEKLEK